MASYKLELIKQITPELSLQQYNEIPVIALDHKVGKALISLQGAHLFSWQPKHTKQDVFWLSEIEPFKLGSAIRGGVPICYPWFNNKFSPSHGYARISLWQLSNYKISDEKVKLAFSLFSEDDIIEAKITMTFSDKCKLSFKHYGNEEAEAALHSYFNISDINNISISGLPTTSFDSLTQQSKSVPETRHISENVDEVYSISHKTKNTIVDPNYQRNIEINHKEASNIVLWNPWHKPTSNMSKEGYKTMVCVETARIEKTINQDDSFSVEIKVK